MEVIVYGALSTLWWMSSLSILLPFMLLLKFNKRFRDKWFSWVFMNCLKPFFNPKLTPLRRHAFDILKQHLSDRKKNVPLEILEIGIGGGANLQFYPENSNLTALDMNENFESYFNENQKQYPQITYKKTVTAMAENMDEIEDASMDVVVCTFVLCSVQNVQAVLNQVRRVLKPGGKFLFLEHVAYPQTQWSFTIQRFVAPLWHLYFDGCFPDRDLAAEIKKNGFSDVVCESKFPNSLLLFIRPQIVGIATK
ncbi:methyltransferase-like protein 7A [Caerostris darwini]|uniref:Methyltransferase-like protein 7A n=1 Tax=Caerostris darwini TaxID=1538125 RepID=A0AAV4S4A3_9ARAC|nr:methyltransferase-like protein 7A [Caerostris darwini]